MVDPDPAEILEAELRARRDAMPASLAKATWQLLLGEVEASVETLRQALAATTDPGGRPEALALLVGDRASAARLAGEGRQRPLVRGWREYQSAILDLIAHDDERARRHVDELAAFASSHDRLPGGPPTTVVDIPAGILDGDADRASRGVDVLLGWHLRSARARSERFNSASGVICLDAIVAVLVAAGRGVAVHVDPQYRRATLPGLAVHITQWVGRPLDRIVELQLETDLVAGPWLAAAGVDIGPAPEPTRSAGTGAGRARARPARPADVDASVAVDELRRRIASRKGSAWQLVCWSFMAGDDAAARAHLHSAIAEARRMWQESRPSSGGLLRRFLRSQELPNSNYVRHHFGLALAARDDRGLEEAGALLRAWMDAVAEDERRQSRPIHPAYEHAEGYLDYLADLFGPSGPRAPAERVSTLPRQLHAACVGLERRDASIVQEAINAILAEHVQALERKTSPPPPLSLPALQIIAAAQRRGLQVNPDQRYASHPVPIAITESGSTHRRIGRVPTDLLARRLVPVDP